MKVASFSQWMLMAAFLLTAPALSAAFLVNGDLETWSGGKPTGWTSTTAPVQGAGLVPGSTFSAIFERDGATAPSIQQTISSGPLDFSVSFTFAASAGSVAGPSGRGLNMIINAREAGNHINLITVNGSTAGKLSLQVFNGTSFVTIANDVFDVSLFDAPNNEFDVINAYQLTLNYRANTTNPTYDIFYSPVSGGTGGSALGLSHFQALGTLPGTGITNITFTQGNGSASNGAYAIDNVVVAPEPSRTVLLMLGAGLLMGLRRRTTSRN